MISIVCLAEKNDVTQLRAALEAGAEINSFELKRGALHAACVTNAIDASTLLIEHGINVNLQDLQKLTPIFMA
jgi:ankyrin repeat protein